MLASVLRAPTSLVCSLVVGAALACGAAVGCSGDDTETHAPPPVKVTPADYGAAYDKLSDWHFFRDPKTMTPADDLVAYDVIAPLFSDYTSKYRFIYIPEGETIGYTDDGPWDLPVGSILVKVFSYPADVREPDADLRLMETRVLWHEPDGWTVQTYVWNDDQTEATLEVAGKTVPVEFIGPDGSNMSNDYRVPNTNECKRCHGEQVNMGEDLVEILGPRTLELDRDHDFGDGPVNQIDEFDRRGWFTSTPTAAADRQRLVDPYDDAEDLDMRVRSYLHANCSSCHRHGGFASQSALLLDFGSTDPDTQDASNWGVCKIPTSADDTCDNTFDIVPGRPDLSIMICRLSTTAIETRMPPLGSKLIHKEGVALLTEWIAAMPPAACTPP
ncbi:MAG: SO2930 family diheme c-type cytochrome [Polyangiaceae bacterium]